MKRDTIIITVAALAIAGIIWWNVRSRDPKESMKNLKTVDDLPQSAIDLIKEFEIGSKIPNKKADGLYYSYDDGAGLNTIGIGHLNTKDKLEGLTEAQVYELFRSDLKSAFVKVKAVVDPAVFASLTGNQIGMLVSFMFNTGAAGSTLFTLVSTRQWDKLLKPISGWWRTHYITSGGKTLNGLIKRRNKEADIFKNDL